MLMEVREPKTKEEFEIYYELRWKILREPWNQPKGSEKDELEDKSFHAMALIGENVVGVGRLHFNSDKEAQIRYMAVDEQQRGKGIGSLIIEYLEKVAKKKGAECIILNARENAVDFYKSHGYNIVKKSHTLFGSIEHFLMRKKI